MINKETDKHVNKIVVTKKDNWWRNMQNEGWKWIGNLYNINKIQYLPVAGKK